jgi:predicted RNA-binding Zn-ribbon protein involved in translation (DUF1610 family)
MPQIKPVFRERPACADNAAVPEYVACAQCRLDVEIWSDEENSACPFCGEQIAR